MQITIPYEQTKQPSEFKKVLFGFAYSFGVEIVFFLIGAACVFISWWLFFHCLGRTDQQTTYVYSPYEIKYVVIVIGGYRKRIAVKKFLKRHKIICQ